jgi:hypothetical protein
VVHLASGAPFNVTTGLDENLDGVTTDRPNGVGRNSGEDTPLGPVNKLRARKGLPPVRSLDEPSFAQVDLRVWKPFPMGQKGQGEVYGQIFNLFDRFNGGIIEGRATSRNFGESIGQVGPPRTFEFGVKVGF